MSRCSLLTVFALLSAAPLAAAPASEAADHPVVVTRFEIAVSNVENGLRAEADAVERWFSCKLAERMAERFGYVDWRPDGPMPAGLQVVGRLDLRLVPTTVAQRFTQLDVVFRAVADRRAVSLPRTTFSWTLYEATEAKPTRPPYVAEFRRRLLSLVQPGARRQLFVNGRLLDELEARFLHAVPIARELVPLESYEALVLPLTAEQLRAADGSVLKAELEVRYPEWPTARRSHLDLYTRDVCRLPGLEGRVETGVSRFELGELTSSGWHPQIPVAVREHRVPHSLRVFMHGYRADPYAEGGGAEGLASLQAPEWRAPLCE